MRAPWDIGPKSWFEAARHGGGKGGGSSAPTQQNVTQTNLPEYARPYFESLLNRAEGESRRGYTPYTGERIAGFAPESETGFQGVEDIYNQGTPQGLLAGQQRAQQAADFGPGDITPYMDPYIQNVLDVQKNRLTQRFGEQGVARDAAAVQAGAFGGSRQAVQDSLAQRDLNEQLNQIEAEGLSNAYNQATSTALNAEQLGLGAAGALADMGATEQELGLNRAQQLMGVGAAREQQQQSGLDLAYQDFVNQRDFRRQQLNFLSGILRGVPVSAESEVSTYRAPPSPTSQLLGLGIGGLGLSRELGQI